MKKNNPRKPFFNQDSNSESPKGNKSYPSKGKRPDQNEGSFSPKKNFSDKKGDGFGKFSSDKKSSFGGDSQRSFGDKPKGKFFKSEEGSSSRPSFGKRFGDGDSERKSFGDKKFEKREGGSFPKKSFGDKTERFQGKDSQGKRFEKRDDSDSSSKSFGDKPKRYGKEGFGEKKFERKGGSDFQKKSFNEGSDRFKKTDFSEGKKRNEGSEPFKKKFGPKPDRFGGNENQEGKFSERKSEKPFFKKDFSGESTSGNSSERLVYKGRGRDEKPVFGPESKSNSSEKPTEKRGFGKNRPNRQELNPDRPDYNFDALPARKTKGKEETDLLRLNKYIANSGICSRREADSLITQGQITVNGEVITEMGHKVRKSDRVVYQGKRINPEKPVYVLLNKPKDFITTTDDPMERKTVMKLVENACEERIFPVGRLDRNTTGLLLFTNDGELTAKLSHPSNEVKKIYQVTLDKALTQRHEEEILNGLTLEDGDVKVDDMQVLSLDRTIIGLEIHIGRNRIVRRLFAHLGYEVVGLDRVMYAGLDKKDLKRGHYRFLTEQEVIRLKFFT